MSAAVHDVKLANLTRYNGTTRAVVGSQPPLPDNLAFVQFSTSSIRRRSQAARGCNSGGRGRVAGLAVELQVGVIHGKDQGQRPQRLQIGKPLPECQEESWSGAVVDVRDVVARRPLEDGVALRYRLLSRRYQGEDGGQGVAFAGPAVAEVDTLAGRAEIEIGWDRPSPAPCTGGHARTLGRSAATPFLAPGGTIAPSILSTIAPIRMPSDDAEPWWYESNDVGRILQGKNSLVTFQAWDNLIGIAEKRKSNQCTTNTTAGKTRRATSNNITKTHSFRSG